MSKSEESSGSGFKPLPRGRHGRDPETLKATRRARLLQAMMELVAERGYAATTVPKVVAKARVSRNAFYEFFKDKEDCFLALCDEQAVDIQKVITEDAVAGDWRGTLRHGLRAYLRWWQQRPEFGRAYFLEMPTVGARAIAQRQAAYKPFEKLFVLLSKWIRGQESKLEPLPVKVPGMLVIMITETVANEIRAGRTHTLTRLEDEFMYVIVRLLYR